MLWVCIYLPRLPLEVFTRQKQYGPLIIEEKTNNRRVVLLANDEAQQAGIQPGTSIPTALGLSNTLSIKKKDNKAEWKNLEQLATWAYQFTPNITLKEHMLLLEVESSLALFHGKEQLCDTLIHGLQDWGYEYRIACCSTPKSAELLAKHKYYYEDHTDHHRELFFDIADVTRCPINLLEIPDKEKQQLASMGLTHLHHIESLPHSAINRRFGTGLSLQLQQILGQAPDIQKNFTLPRTFDQSIHFVEELTHTNSLLFPLKRLFSYLENYLVARQLLCNSFVVTFHERFQQQHSFVMQLTQPHYRQEYLLSLIKLKLENLALQQPVIGIKVSARYFSPMTQQNRDLFGSTQEDRQSASALIDTLSTRLGESAITRIALHDDHRPEHAAKQVAIKEPSARYQPKAPHDTAASIQTQHPQLTRPLWLFQTPQPLRHKKGVPIYGERLQLIKGPERIETGWWDQQPINRDYYVAQHPAGVIYWVYLDREQATEAKHAANSPHYPVQTPSYQQWYLHGVFG